MQTSSRYTLSIGASLGCISLLYFLSLLLPIPFIITVPAITVALFILIKWINKVPFTPAVQERKWARWILIAAVFIITNKAYYLAQEHGVWDAWAIWNMHAGYLTDPLHWKNMLLNTQLGHPDYPLALPSVIAFFNRLFAGHGLVLIAFAIHFLITLCIPLLVFLEVQKRNLFVAGLSLLFFVNNEFYIAQGVSQLADTMLAFFFLAAIIAIKHHEEDKRMLVLTGAFLGLCIWTKNEGIVLAVIFALFNAKSLFGTNKVKYTLTGIAAPLLVWLVFKGFYAPANDMVSGQSKRTYDYIFDWQRYKLIYTYLSNNLNNYFKYTTYGVLLYLLFSIIRRKLPDANLLMILTCLLAYLCIYIVSPNDLEWHLFTSQSRLLHQLMPATVYVLAMKFSGGTKKVTQGESFSILQRLR